MVKYKISRMNYFGSDGLVSGSGKVGEDGEDGEVGESSLIGDDMAEVTSVVEELREVVILKCLSPGAFLGRGGSASLELAGYSLTASFEILVDSSSLR